MKGIIAVLSVALILGCVSGMAVEKGDKVSVEYTGTLENGTVFDSSVGREPLEFNAGEGQMIKGFDDAVIGMKEGEEKTVTLSPADAYGDYDPRNIAVVAIQNVPEGVKAGDTLYASGQSVKVVEVRNDSVIIDVNHALAGKTLIFRIKMLKIEKAQK